MKRILILFLLALSGLSGQAQGWEKVKKETKRNGVVTSTVRGWARRDLTLYPQTTSGTNSFTTAVNAGQLAIALTDPNAVPNSLKARYSLNSNLLNVEAGGDITALKFERADGTAMTGTNPDGVALSSGVFYGYGTNNSPPYDKQWKATFSPAVAGKQLKLTFRQSSGSTYSYNVILPNANVTAVGVPLFGTVSSTGSTTTNPGSTTTNPGSGTTTTPTTTTALAFVPVSYDCGSGVLQYKFTSALSASVTYSWPGINAETIAPGTVRSVTLPSDQRVDKTLFTGTASQPGSTAISWTLKTSCTLTSNPPTTTPPTTDPPVSTTWTPSGFNWQPLSTAVAPGDSLVTFETPYTKTVVALAQRWGKIGPYTGPRLSGAFYKHYNKSEPGFNLMMYSHYSTADGGSYSPESDGDNFTMGTGYGLGNCIYMNPLPNYVPGQAGNTQVPPYGILMLGRNQVRTDDHGNTARVLQYGKYADGSGYYMKYIPVLYNAYGAYAYGTIFEDWTEFHDKLTVQYSKITMNYTLPVDDPSGYGMQVYVRNTGQEMPCLYGNGSIDSQGGNKNKVSFVQSNNPCTSSATITTIDVSKNKDKDGNPIYTSMRGDASHVTEPWVMLHGPGTSATAKGVGLILTESKFKIGNFGSGDSKPDRISPNTNTTYINENSSVIFDNKGKYYYYWRMFTGTPDEIRAEACKVSNQFAKGPNYRWDIPDRQKWGYSPWGDNATIPGGPQEARTSDGGPDSIAINGFWRLKLGRSIFSGLSSPGVAWDASVTKKIYIKLQYWGEKNSFTFSWLRNGELPNRAPETDEERARFFRGKQRDGQNKTVSVNNTGAVQVLEIDLSNHSLWSDIITEFQINPHASGVTSGSEFMNLYWISTDPNGPPTNRDAVFPY